MTRFIRAFIVGGILAAVAAPANAAFEQLGAGARPIGMGGAFTAVSDDAYAIHYNPAGLAQVRRAEFTGGYGKLLAGLKDESNLGSGFVGVVQPIKSGAYGSLGLGWLSLNLQDAYREDTLSFSYGKELIAEGLFVGASGKVLKRSFGSDIYTQADPLFMQKGYNTANLSFDLGMIYRPDANYSFGFSAKDMNQPNVGLSASDKVPGEIRAGFAYRQRTLLFDAELSRKGKDIHAALGLEKWLLKSFALRAGLSGGARNRRDISAGLGYAGSNFNIDYAFIFPLGGIESTAGSHHFSLTVRLGKAPERASWDFEEDAQFMERLLNEKSAQISAMEKEMQDIKDQNLNGKRESDWVRNRIKNLENKIHEQEMTEMQELKTRVLQSNVESQKMRQKVRELELRIQSLSSQTRKVAPASSAGKPAPVSAPASAPIIEEKKLPEMPRTYQVMEGETLQSIADKFYGEPSKWMEIYKLNSDRLERGGTLTPGQVLLMPQP